MHPDLLNGFVEIVGANHALTSDDDLTHYTHENRGLFVGNTPLVLKPGSTEEVAGIVKLAASTKTQIVPQGGHTGHVGGAVPDESGDQIVVSLERMNRIREVDLDGNVVICEAGCVLETIQNEADKHDRLFPLSLGSQGSCHIGGNISSNAGGTGVLAYGNTRQLVAGLEVVLPSGEIWHGLRRLKKDNTGYDLKDLFIGAEGTLGIVTAAVLKVFPKPKGKSVAFCGMGSVEDTVALLGSALRHAGTSLTAFEFMAELPVRLTCETMDGVRNPLEAYHPWHVMMEISSSLSEENANELMEAILGEALEAGTIVDASIAASGSQQNAIWNIRETMPLAQLEHGGSMKHDIALPIRSIPDFLARAEPIVMAIVPDSRLYTFGHLGDGNIHYNITQPEGADKEAFLALQPEVNRQIHDLVASMNGSVAAEHGVGRLKRDLIARTKDLVELQMMKTLKASFDPDGIMNPGKVI